MDTLERLRQLMAERNWTMYRLAKEGDLSHSTVKNIFSRNTIPSIDTLERICKAFGITIAQFFAEGEMIDLSPELKRVFDSWVGLTVEQKQLVQSMMDAFNHDK